MTLAPGTIVGRIIGLWRYPVKSMRGEVLANVEAGEGGFVGDRAFGVVDVATGHLLSAKRVPELLRAHAMFRNDGEATIVLPDGRVIGSDDPEVDERLSAWLGRGVFLDRPTAGQRGRIEIETDLDDPSVVREFQTRPGLFFDSVVMHLVTDASLRAAAAFHPAGPWVAERFRPNVLVESVVGEGFIEDSWVGSALDVSGMRVDVQKRCQRCVLVTRAVGATPTDKDVLRTLAREHGGDLGVNAHVSGAGRVLVGDDLVVTTAP